MKFGKILYYLYALFYNKMREFQINKMYVIIFNHIFFQKKIISSSIVKKNIFFIHNFTFVLKVEIQTSYRKLFIAILRF